MNVRVRGVAARITLAALALGIVLALTWPVRAAVELTYYTVTSITTGVVLQWATASEYNLEGFEILCKPETAADTAYTPVGSRIAQGGPELGATYDFPIVSGLTPGISYCFRIREITTDGTPGDVFERCGYGPNLTPTPGFGATPTLTPASLTPTTTVAIIPTASLTPIVVTPISATGSQNQPATAVPTAVIIATAPAPAVATVEQPTPTASPTQITLSPLTTPTASDTTAQSGVADDGGNAQAGASTVNVQSTAVADPNRVSPLATPAPTNSPIPQPTAPPSPTAAATADGMANQSGAAPTPEEAIVIPPAVQSSPTAPYVVVTFTPTSPAAVALATFTPLPTVTPTPGLTFADIRLPSSENLLFLTLCFVFFGASGLGVLGLTTIGLYVRSRSSRSSNDIERYNRNRRL